MADAKKPVLDKKILKNLSEIMAEDFSFVLQEYLDNSLGLLRQMHESVEEENSEALIKVSQKLKTGSNEVGAIAVAAFSEKMVNMGNVHDFIQARSLLPDLEDIYNKTHRKLQDIQKKAKISALAD